MYKYHLPQISVFTFLISLLLFLYKHNIQSFNFTVTIKYNYTTHIVFFNTLHMINRQELFESIKIYYDKITN